MSFCKDFFSIFCPYRKRNSKTEAYSQSEMPDDNEKTQKTTGYLEKRGKLKFMNSWKKYWFVLEGNLLLYYSSKDDYDALSPCRGSIPLGPTSTVKPYSSAPIGFQITTRSSIVTLRADNVPEQIRWIQALVSALNQNQSPNKSPTSLSHFRYSKENLNLLVDNTQSQKKGITSENQQRLEKLSRIGAISYSDHFQNEMIAAVKKRSIQIEKEERASNEVTQKSLHSLSTLKHSELTPNRQISEENEEFLLELEFEDFCVCTLGERNDDITEDEETKVPGTMSTLESNSTIKAEHEIHKPEQETIVNQVEENLSQSNEINYDHLKTDNAQIDITNSAKSFVTCPVKCSRQISLLGACYSCKDDVNLNNIEDEHEKQKNICETEVVSNNYASSNFEELECKIDLNEEYEYFSICNEDTQVIGHIILPIQNSNISNETKDSQKSHGESYDSSKVYGEPRESLSTHQYEEMNDIYEAYESSEINKFLHEKANEIYEPHDEIHNEKGNYSEPYAPNDDNIKLKYSAVNKIQRIRPPNFSEEICYEHNELYSEQNESCKKPEESYNDPEIVIESSQLNSQFYNEPRIELDRIDEEKPKPISEVSQSYSELNELYDTSNDLYNEPTEIDNQPNELYNEPNELYNEPDHLYIDPDQLYIDPDRLYNNPRQIYNDPTFLFGKCNELTESQSETPKTPELNLVIRNSCNEKLKKTSRNIRQFRFPPPPKEDFHETEKNVQTGNGQNSAHGINQGCAGKDGFIENELYEIPFALIKTGKRGVQTNDESYASPLTKVKLKKEVENELYSTCDGDIEDCFQIDNDLYASVNLSPEYNPNTSHFKFDFPPRNRDSSNSFDLDEHSEHIYQLLLNDDENTYEDLDKISETIRENEIAKQDKGRKSDTFLNEVSPSDCKKTESLIHKLLNQTLRKHKNKNKTSQLEKDPDLEKTLLMLKNIQDLLEKKKGEINAMAKGCSPKERQREKHEKVFLHSSKSAPISSYSQSPQKTPLLKIVSSPHREYSIDARKSQNSPEEYRKVVEPQHRTGMLENRTDLSSMEPSKNTEDHMDKSDV